MYAASQKQVHDVLEAKGRFLGKQDQQLKEVTDHMTKFTASPPRIEKILTAIMPALRACCYNVNYIPPTEIFPIMKKL